jgi:hypothetical protein
MPIETICQTCARKLRVADEYAGKRARCPQCNTIYIVPGTPAAVTNDLVQTHYAPRPDSDKWQVRTPDGRVYGPVLKRELDEWVSEGRVPAEAYLQRESDPTWQPATALYPHLQSGSGLQASNNPFVDSPAASPFVAQGAMGHKPHRGATILVLALLSFLCCPLLAPVAWIMGHSDLREMRAGQMDASGLPLTQAGMILGIISTILSALGLAAVCLGELA